MPERIHGHAGAQDVLDGELDTFTVYVKAPNSVKDPGNTKGVNIRVTGNLNDVSQKNFEMLIQSIGLRALPVKMDDPKPTADLGLIKAPSLKGEGFVWRFAVEAAEVFTKRITRDEDNPVGLLIEELNGIVLPCGEILNTGKKGNIEFVKIGNG